MTRIILWALLSIVAAGNPLAAQQWDRFRGPNGAGASEAEGIPVTWSGKDYLWKVKLPGTGHSSPVVWDNSVYITSANDSDGTHFVLCFDLADGHELWKRSFPGAIYRKHTLNSFASATPAMDANHIYLIWSRPEQYDVVALDRKTGKDVWSRNLGLFTSQHGSGASPIVYEDSLIVTNDQDGESSLNALDCATGKTRWMAPRRTAITAFSTPFMVKASDGADELIVTSKAHGISSYDPHGGNLKWELPVMQYRLVGSPILASGLIFAACGEGGVGKQMFAAAPPDVDKKQAARVAYKVDAKIPYVVTPIAYDPWIFLWTDQGIVTCLDAASGKTIWQQRVGGHYFGSPIRVRDRLYAISQEGEVVVIAAADKFKLLGQTKLDEPSVSTPAVSHGLLLLRTDSQLMAVGKLKDRS